METSIIPQKHFHLESISSNPFLSQPPSFLQPQFPISTETFHLILHYLYHLSYPLHYNSSSFILKPTYHPLIQQIHNSSSNAKSKQNSIILFDWDDTLLCSTYLKKHNFFSKDIDVNHKEKLSKIEKQVHKLLLIALQLGDVYIITNASRGWVEISAMRYYPSIVELLSKVKIISARTAFEECYPNDIKMWKFITFANVANLYDKNKETNIICVGDSNDEMEAAMKMGFIFKKVYIKTIKCKKEPNIAQAIKQLSLLSEHFENIFLEERNVSIIIEKKGKMSHKKKKQI